MIITPSANPPCSCRLQYCIRVCYWLDCLLRCKCAPTFSVERCINRLIVFGPLLVTCCAPRDTPETQHSSDTIINIHQCSSSASPFRALPLFPPCRWSHDTPHQFSLFFCTRWFLHKNCHFVSAQFGPIWTLKLFSYDFQFSLHTNLFCLQNMKKLVRISESSSCSHCVHSLMFVFASNTRAIYLEISEFKCTCFLKTEVGGKFRTEE